MSARADSSLITADSTLVTADGHVTVLVDGLTVEVEWAAGVWTDVTTDVDLGGDSLVITQGRRSVWDDSQPGSLAFTLEDPDGVWTPDNPLSAFWPYVGDPVRVRVTLTHAGAMRRRFLGWVDGWRPSSGGDTPTVAVTATDRLGQLTRALPSALQQYLEARSARYTTARTWSVHDLPAPPASPRAQLTVASANPAGPAATLWVDRSTRGQLAAADVTGLGLPAGWDLGTNDAARRGCALRVPVDTACVRGGVWFRSEQQVTAAEGWDNVLAALSQYGSRKWRAALAYDAAGTCLELRKADETVVVTVPGLADGAWHSLAWEAYNAGGFVGPSVRWFVDGVDVGHTAMIGPVGYMILGGEALTSAPYAVTRQMRGSIAGPWSSADTDTGASTTATVARGTGGVVLPWPTVAQEIRDASGGALGTVTILGTDTRSVQVANGDGRTILEHLVVLARTIGGAVWHDPATDAIVVAGPDTVRPLTATVTVTAGLDDADDVTWARGIDDRPTRATASASGVGSVTVVDSVAESQGIRDVSVDTLAPTEGALAAVASGQLARARKLRATSVPVDLHTAVTDLWAGLLTVRPGTRVALAGLPARFGTLSRDLLVAGWSETYTGPGWVRVDLTTDAADDPMDAVWDDTIRGRWGTDGLITLNAAVTVGATTITTTTAGLALTTASGDWPFDLSVGGERVTVTAVTGAGPVQTLTVTRGVSPSIAAPHPAGTPVELWGPPSWTM